jgi:hypothetical protein
MVSLHVLVFYFIILVLLSEEQRSDVAKNILIYLGFI